MHLQRHAQKLFFITWLGLGLSSCAGIRAQSTAALSGVVVDTLGVAIADASISLSSETMSLETKSDSRGRFEFRNLSPGSYKLEAQYPGFEKTALQLMLVADDRVPPTLTITINDGMLGGQCGLASSVSYNKRNRGDPPLIGTVQPIPPKPEPNVDLPEVRFPDAVIEVYRIGSKDVVASKHPDLHGKFEFSGLALGEYFLKVSYTGYFDAFSVKFQVTREGVADVTIPIESKGETTVCL